MQVQIGRWNGNMNMNGEMNFANDKTWGVG